jgi:hypothetical protein
MRCVWYTNTDQCQGRLHYRGTQSSKISVINGIDTNREGQYFECEKCKRKFVKISQWGQVNNFPGQK